MSGRTLRIILTGVAWLAAASASLAADREHNTLTQQEAAEGWLLLFDGKTMFGWENHGDGKWKVVDGALVCEEGTAGWLGTTTEFADCVFKCQYRVDAKGNSGVFLRAKRDSDRPWVDGYEIQICDDHERNPTGSVYGVISTKRPGATRVTTVEKWQDMEIRVEGNRFRIFLNGTKVVDDVDKRPGPDGQPGMFKRGHVGLQYHNPGMKIEFRDVKLRPLGAESIFNGKDLTGWEVLKGPRLHSKITVQPPGVLNLRSGHGQVATKAQWSDFALQLEIMTGKEHVNSGVFFRAIPGLKWMGYEAQIYNRWLDGDRGKPKDYGTGGIYRRQPARGVYASDREWFTMTVVAHGRHIATWVNGQQAADWTDPRDRHENPRRGYRPEAGVILFQGHDRDGDLSFRNIRVAAYPQTAGK